MFLLISEFGSLDYGIMSTSAMQGSHEVVTAIALLLLVAAIGKSAQIPLFPWLPDAMEGPTPVSALIHAATMVTAGVYLVVRMHLFFEISGVALTVVLVVGLVTALYAGLSALAQDDIKRVLAYSTISQLGSCPRPMRAYAARCSCSSPRRLQGVAPSRVRDATVHGRDLRRWAGSGARCRGPPS
jgi:NADH-quinone oxidoreductase subunit L